MKFPLSARVAADTVAKAKIRAAESGVSLSVIVERALKAYLDQLGDLTEDKPAWAIAHEERIAKLESQSQGQAEPQNISRKSKRRR